MTRKEMILNFAASLRKEVAQIGENMILLYESGRKESKEYTDYMARITEMRHISSVFFDEWYTIADDQDEVQYNFLEETDIELEQIISDMSYRLGINVQSYGAFPLISLNITETEQVSTEGVSLPPGGGTGYFLTQDSGGNYIWVSYNTIQDNLEV